MFAFFWKSSRCMLLLQRLKFCFFAATWTLLHLCAKYDLFKLGEYLVTRNGASQALLVRDEGNFTPMDIASANENIRFMELFSRLVPRKFQCITLVYF